MIGNDPGAMDLIMKLPTECKVTPSSDKRCVLQSTLAGLYIKGPEDTVVDGSYNMMMRLCQTYSLATTKDGDATELYGNLLNRFEEWFADTSLAEQVKEHFYSSGE